MELTQVKGNTYVLEGEELIPLYLLGGGKCILLDTGLLKEREDLEHTLLEHGLTPAAILCSHAHIDHCASNRYFQEKYGAQVWLTPEEAGLCRSLLSLKCYFLTLPMRMIREESECLVHRPDHYYPIEDGPFEAEGHTFRVVHTPGHSVGHVSVITPDNVCYAADALLSGEKLNAKLPYGLSLGMMMESREKLPGLGCDAYIIAHRSVCSGAEIGELVRQNQALLLNRVQTVKDLLAVPRNFCQVTELMVQRLELHSHRPRRGLYYERNVHFLLDFLVDLDEVDMTVESGVVYYRRKDDGPVRWQGMD